MKRLRAPSRGAWLADDDVVMVCWPAVCGESDGAKTAVGTVVVDLDIYSPDAGMLMRHSEREIHDRHLIDDIITGSQVLRLGLCKESLPYIVPVCFGYDGEYIYIHTSIEGMKIDYIGRNNQVCFEMEHDVEIVPDDNNACKWSVSFYSVIGFGIIQELLEYEKKIYALQQIMRHYSTKIWEFDGTVVKRTKVWRIVIGDISAKQSQDRIKARSCVEVIAARQ